MYHYDSNTKSATCLLDGSPIGNGGEFVVESIDGVDEEGGWIYFSGNRGESTQRHLYVASFLKKMSAVQVTTEAGWHVATVSAKHHMMAEIYRYYNYHYY